MSLSPWQPLRVPIGLIGAVINQHQSISSCLTLFLPCIRLHGLLRTTVAFAIILLSSTVALGQGEANIWYFGNGAGLDFNSGSPVNLTNGAMVTNEGCASISDPQGALRFYTDGITVWNANHQAMTNGTGLQGHSSSTQSAIIIPKPYSNQIYYIFTAPAAGITPSSNLYYSEVDMSLSGGLGAVTTNKNIFLMSPAGEKLTATMHANGTDIWVLNQKHNSDSIYAFLVSSAGVNTTPVVSPGAFTVTGFYGYMKASPQGDVVARSNQNNVNLYNFNKTTGQLSHFLTIPVGTGSPVYGVEFSPDGTKLYLNRYSNGLYQVNLAAGTNAQITSSLTFIGSSLPATGQALQLAPDGKIYATGFSSALSVINSPDSLGAACNYVANAFNLSPKTGRWGLPTFIQTYFDPLAFGNVQDTCENDTTQFSVTSGSFGADSIFWDFGDTASGVNNQDTGSNPSHVFSGPGTFEVTIVAYLSDSVGTALLLDTVYDTISVTIHPLPIIDLGGDTILCEGDSFTIQNSNTSLQMDYLWNDSSTNESIQITEIGTYWVEVTTLCGVDYDTVSIDSIIPALVHLGPDTLLCDGDSVTLDATVAAGAYTWSDGSTDSVLIATQTGSYSVTSTGYCNVDSDTIKLWFVELPHSEFANDTTLCDGENFTLVAIGDSASFHWQDGSTDSTFTVTSAGWYSVTATNVCGMFTDSVQAIFDFPHTVDLGSDTVVCEGFSYVLDPNLPGENTFLWNDSTTDTTITVAQAGDYWVEATNTCGSYSDTVKVEYEVVPEVDIGPDTLLCDGGQVPMNATFSRATYQWNTGEITPTITATTAGNYQVTVTNLCGTDIDSRLVVFDFPLEVYLGNATSVCEGDSVNISALAPNNPSYKWNTGAKTAEISVYQSGRYAVTVTNTCGSYSGEIFVQVDPLPNASLPRDTTVCAESEIKLAAGGVFDHYLWSTGAVSRSIVVNEAGDYWLSIDDKCGFYSDTISVRFAQPHAFENLIDTFVCSQFGPAKLDAGPDSGRSFIWNSFQEGSPIEVTESGDYTVSATDEWGCVSVGRVAVGDCPFRIFIPNAFSPNRDNFNDEFLVKAEYITDYALYIYDRWGELLFQSNDLSSGWDGTYRNILCPIGSYPYLVKFKAEGVGRQELKGQVNLLR